MSRNTIAGGAGPRAFEWPLELELELELCAIDPRKVTAQRRRRAMPGDRP